MTRQGSSERQASAETHINRYDRQELIEGWDQSRLTDTSLLIVGSDILAQYAALAASALGFGRIEIHGQGKVGEAAKQLNPRQARGASHYHRGFLLYDQPPELGKAKAAASICKMVNGNVDIDGYRIDLGTHGNWSVVSPTAIIDATNDPSAKAEALRYAAEHNIPIVSVASTDTEGALGVAYQGQPPSKELKDNLLFPMYRGARQGEITSMVLGALAVEEARKAVMPLTGERKLEDIVIYNPGTPERFADGHEHAAPEQKTLLRAHVLQVGAGSLGNFTALGFALRETGKLTIVDDDTIEETNLNRQPFLYGAVGRHKVTALIDKLRRINPRVEYEGLAQRVTPAFEEYLEREKPDIIVDTVDNNASRALLNYFSLKHRIPLVSGGTRHNSGQATVAMPDGGACLDCKVDIDRLALSGYRPTSCILAPTPSVITSNQIIGGFLVEEAQRVLAPDAYGPPASGILKYVSAESQRFARLPATARCGCADDAEKLGSWMERMGHLYGRNGGRRNG